MPNKRTGEYWKKRFEMLENASNKYGQDTFRQIESTFDKSQREIQKEIERWYGRYARNNNISMTEAKRQLSTTELKEFRWDVNEYIKYGRENAIDERWMKELENASARVHISRLEALKLRTQQYAEVAFGNELDSVDAMARKVLTEDYYKTCFEVQKGFGIGWDIGTMDERKVDKYISKPWTNDGKTFSNRIWDSKNAMISELHQQLTKTCILGKAPDEAIEHMTKFVNKKFDNAKYQAGRLVMTEQAYFHSVSQKEAFGELDVEEFEFVATLDSHTSEICQEMDGKHFPMSEYEIGVNVPPLHPFCRSVTVPYFEDNYTGERAARDENGKTYYVPDSMTYKEWKNGFVDGNTDDLTVLENSDIKELKKDLIEDVLGIKKGNPISLIEAVKGANPNYSNGGAYRINCQRCVQAYELRRRGYDVTALPKPSKNNIVSWGSECFIEPGQYKNSYEAFTLYQTESQVKKELNSAADGARYTIYVKWKGRNNGAHVFIAEKENGVVKFIDPQSGEEDVGDYFKRGSKGMFGFFRMDDKPITSDANIIKSTVEVIKND